MSRKLSLDYWIFWPGSGIKILLFIFYKLRIEDLWHLQTIAQNQLNGFGLNYVYAHAENISELYTKPLIKWPPLLSLAITGLSYLTRNVDLSVLILDAGGMMALLLAIRRIARLSNISDKLRIMLYLVIFTNLTTIDLFSTSDILAAAFFLWGSAGIFSLLTDKATITKIIFVSFILFLPATLRYQFYPLIFLPGIFLLAFALINKEKRIANDSIKISFFVLVFLVVQVIALNYYSGQASYIKDEMGIYPGNLKWLDFFYLKSFIPVHQLFSFAQQNGLSDIETVYIIVSAINILLLILLVYFASVYKSPVPANNLFSAFVIWVTLGWIVFLCSLSLFFKMQRNGSPGFTYVMGTRYWSVPIFLLPVLTVAISQNLKKAYSRVIDFILAGVIIFNSAVIVNRVYKPLLLHDYSATYPGRMADKKRIGSVIDNLLREEKKPVILACYDEDFGMYNSDKTYALVDNYEYFINHKIREEANVYLLLITSINETQKEKAFIKENDLKRVFSGNGLHLYRYQ